MELQWIGVAFALGLIAKRLGQPPVIGFLAAGFVLEVSGLRPDASLHELADIGVLLLLFTIGLKLDLREIARPHVWGVAVAHMGLSTLLAGAGLSLAIAWGVPLLSELVSREAWSIAFALSFSSTIFAVKLLQDRDDLGAVYGRSAVGILVVQDIAAVTFVALSGTETPNLWALCLFLLLPLRPLLHRLISASGHGELLVLAGLAATLAAAALFKTVGIKADLGALAAGALLGGHPKSKELAKALFSFKDVFLVGFFLSVGLTGLPTWETLGIALVLLVVLPAKGLLFVGLSMALRLRARSSLLLGASLGQLSEFGLIVLSSLVAQGSLPNSWLVGFAIALAMSFAISSPVNAASFSLYRRIRHRLVALERPERIPDEEAVDASRAEILIFGMGRLGSATYDALVTCDHNVVAFDLDPEVVARQQSLNRPVYLGSATDADLWERLHIDRDRIRWVVLTMPSHLDQLNALTPIGKGIDSGPGCGHRAVRRRGGCSGRTRRGPRGACLLGSGFRFRRPHSRCGRCSRHMTAPGLANRKYVANADGESVCPV